MSAISIASAIVALTFCVLGLWKRSLMALIAGAIWASYCAYEVAIAHIFPSADFRIDLVVIMPVVMTAMGLGIRSLKNDQGP